MIGIVDDMMNAIVIDRLVIKIFVHQIQNHLRKKKIVNDHLVHRLVQVLHQVHHQAHHHRHHHLVLRHHHHHQVHHPVVLVNRK